MKQNALTLVLLLAVAGLGLWGWSMSNEARRSAAVREQYDRNVQEWMGTMVYELKKEFSTQQTTNNELGESLRTQGKQLGEIATRLDSQMVPPQTRKEEFDKGRSGLTDQESQNLNSKVAVAKKEVETVEDEATRKLLEKGVGQAEAIAKDPVRALKDEDAQKELQNTIKELLAELERSRQEIAQVQEERRAIAKELEQLRATPNPTPEQEEQRRELEERERKLKEQEEKLKQKNKKIRLVLAIIKIALNIGAMVAIACGQPKLGMALFVASAMIPSDLDGGGPGGENGTGGKGEGEGGGSRLPQPPPLPSATPRGDKPKDPDKKPPEGTGKKPSKDTNSGSGVVSGPKDKPGDKDKKPPKDKDSGPGGVEGSKEKPENKDKDKKPDTTETNVKVVKGEGDVPVLRGTELFLRKKGAAKADFFAALDASALEKIKAGKIYVMTQPGKLRRVYVESPEDSKRFWKIEVEDEGRGKVSFVEIPESEIPK